ncbi:MAG: hypothetical protein [Bacteriophage sp.]|nr:MAG: hypothetical protein [Bacteriophage sp.]
MTNIKQFNNNSIQVVGWVKSKDISYATAKDGGQVIRGSVTMEVPVTQQDGSVQLNNVRLNVYQSQFFKSGKANPFYEGFETVIREYVAKDEDAENATYARANGDISWNVYTNNSGQVVENNRLSARSFSRVDPNVVKPKAVGTLDVYVNDYKEHMEHGEPTNTYDVNGFYVGYNGRVNKLVDFIAPAIMYEKGLQGTWTIGYHINNYAVVDKKQDEAADGFGTVEEIRSNSYVNNMQITGAQSNKIQVDEEQAQEAINEIRQEVAREQNTQIVETVSGFGNNPFGGAAKPSAANPTINNDDLPF